MPNISLSRSCHTSQINPFFSPNSDLATTTQINILLIARDSNKVQTMVGENKLNLTHKDNLLKTSIGCKGPLFTQTDSITASFIHDTINRYIPYSFNNYTKKSTLITMFNKL